MAFCPAHFEKFYTTRFGHLLYIYNLFDVLIKPFIQLPPEMLRQILVECHRHFGSTAGLSSFEKVSREGGKVREPNSGFFVG